MVVILQTKTTVALYLLKFFRQFMVSWEVLTLLTRKSPLGTSLNLRNIFSFSQKEIYEKINLQSLWLTTHNIIICSPGVKEINICFTCSCVNSFCHSSNTALMSFLYLPLRRINFQSIKKTEKKVFSFGLVQNVNFRFSPLQWRLIGRAALCRR